MRFYLATGNQGKVREFQHFLGDSVTAVPVDVEENGSTFEENALIKARAAQNTALGDDDAIYIADDSGLCIDALDGAPGIYSARYAEPGHRKEKVLQELDGITGRRAKFVCAIAAVYPDGAEFTVQAECFGTIAPEPRGTNGFGYDPIFLPDEFPGQTMAEITSEQKNQISHRAKAILALKNSLGLCEKIAIFGGTFDPPHIGHRSYYDLEAYDFDKFIIIPTGTPPHKELNDNSATAEQRFSMAALTFPECEISDIEQKREGKSYTSDTVRELMKQNPGAKFTFLMGTDMYKTLDKWYEYRWLQDNISFKCLDRGVIPVSSSKLRSMLPLRQGREQLVPEVYAFIIKNRLYDAKPDFDWLREQVFNCMDNKRTTHVLGVEKAALQLAEHYGVDVDEARTAAILHDITKLKNREQHLTYLHLCDIIPQSEDIVNDKLLHAISGAELARREFGVSDAVFNAVRWHTTGRPHMSHLEEIIYLADFIEENRHFDGVDSVREIAFDGINKAMELALSIGIAEVKSSGAFLHPASENAYDYYRRLNG